MLVPMGIPNNVKRNALYIRSILLMESVRINHINKHVMRKGIIHICVLVAAMAVTSQAFGKPAKSGVFTLTEADGTEIRVRLAGDEFYHQYFTEDGYPLFERDGNFYYGDIDSEGNAKVSNIKARNVELRDAVGREYLSRVDKTGLEDRIRKRASLSSRRRTQFSGAGIGKDLPSVHRANANKVGNDAPPYERGYGLFPEQRFPAYGNQKSIVILVEYKDVKFSSGYDAHDYFSRMLNEDGFSDLGATGGAAEYFRYNSDGAFCPEFDVYGPVTLSQNRSYYGGNNNSVDGADKNPGAMVKEACDALDATVDFSEYDRNGDGLVDNIFIFYAGRGEASGGGSDTVWPHSWNMEAAGFPNLRYDGVQVYTYGCSNEWENGRPDGVGTFIHEFSHVIGLPDLYSTSYTNSFTPGAWSVLDSGPYNNDGMTPPNYGAFERYALGWLKPAEVTGPLSAALLPVDSNMAGIIRTSNDKEFFLIENRQQTGWDAYIPGHGMLVWHVDYNDEVWTRNIVNDNPSHQYVDIEEADGSQSSHSRSGDSFPGISGKTSFTASTRPAMKTWSGAELDYPITNITEKDGIIYFDVLGGAEENKPMPEPKVGEPEDVTPNSFTISWDTVEGYDVVLNVYTRPGNAGEMSRSAGEIEYLPGFHNRNLGDASTLTITGLESKTVYYYTVAYSDGWNTSVPTEEKSAYTEKFTIDYYSVRATEASDVMSDGFTANWDPLEDATEYYVNVVEMIPGEPYEDICDFSDFEEGRNLRGWTSTTAFTYSIPGNCGESAPSLRMSDSNILTTPVYTDGVISCQFWHRGINNTGSDVIEVYAVTPDGQKLVTKVDVDKVANGVTTNVDGFPEGTNQIVFKFVRNGQSGYLAVDDIKVLHGREYTSVPVEGMTDLSVGNVCSYVVKGLAPLTEYQYTVRATDGKLYSKESEGIRVKTSEALGVDEVANGGFPRLMVKGLTVTADDGAELIVTDVAGVVVARGKGLLTLPASGLYIVCVPSRHQVAKLLIK